MRFLIVNADYPEFLTDLYARHPGLEEQSYDEQLRARYDSLFSVADFYSYNLRQLGHDAWDVYVNNEPLQRAWARENGVRLPPSRRLSVRLRRGLLPWPFLKPDESWAARVLAAQIEDYRPDVLLNQNVFAVPEEPLQHARNQIALMIVQHAATLPPTGRDYSLYDVGISSYPSTLERLRDGGTRAVALHRLGFEPRVLERVRPRDRTVSVSFVGSFHAVHSARFAWLRSLARAVPLDIWASDVQGTEQLAQLGARTHGPAWGKTMYEVLASSAITLNHHGDVGPYANNLRMFEATGMGALLITDWKKNLQDYFQVGTEVVAYRTSDECIEQIEYYLEHDEERQAIAQAGQRRTLKDHTWLSRMEELVDIVSRYL